MTPERAQHPNRPDMTPERAQHPNGPDMTPERAQHPNRPDMTPERAQHPNGPDMTPERAQHPNRPDMTPERWQQVKALLGPVLELEPDQRPAFLDRACATDSSLRRDVEELLDSDEEVETEFLNEPQRLRLPWEPEPGGDFSELADDWVGRRVGPYRIVEQIGAGGMGKVYRAFRADDQYRKQVALKALGAGQDSGLVIGRFKNERQILASLDHPNIARLHDGGTTAEGTPYFVMELIEGQPIDHYCDQHQLSITQRLGLFLLICSAVQYAHQRLIIHRDLKPSNILVTAEGVPKLLDFGIAKILDVETTSQLPEFTVAGLRLLTPGYASPEQVKGQVITTASDVYSLGVLLYELLVGCRPDQASGCAPHEIAQATCEREPEKPSLAAWRAEARAPLTGTAAPPLRSAAREGSRRKLRKRLRGDLDNIVLMALRKEPQRRYVSVEQFATDIRRHLAHESVISAKDTLRYRASKFVRRHSTGVAAAVVVMMAVLAGVAATLHEAQIARAQQRLAEQRFNDLRGLANSLMFDVHDSIQDLPGSTPARKILVERALRYLDRLSRDPASDPSLERELATAYEKVGTVQGNPFGANLGDITGAIESYRKALSIRKSLSTTARSVEDVVALARIQRLFAATVANRSEDWDEKQNMENELAALATANRAYRLAPSDPQVLLELEANYGILATFRQAVGDHRAASEYLKWQQKILQIHLQSNLADPSLRVALAKNEVRSGQELGRLGFQNEALDSIRHGIQILTALSADGRDANTLRYLGLSQDCLGDAWLTFADVRKAVQAYSKEVGILESLQAKDPSNAVVQFDVATAVAKLGNALAIAHDTQAGLARLEQASAMLQSQIDRDPSYNEPPWSLALTKLWTGEVLARNGRTGPALENYRKALAVWKTDDHPLAQAIAADTHLKIANVFEKAGKLENASQEAHTALAIAKQVSTTYPYVLDAQYVLADTYAQLGELSRLKAVASHAPSPDLEEARAYYEKSLDLWGGIHNPGGRAPAGFACGSPAKVSHDLASVKRQSATSKRIEMRLTRTGRVLGAAGRYWHKLSCNAGRPVRA
jgi:serine/threonine protein kinase/tetratricopeptide (TPR) repeat protein